jgi:hypothetical protein
VHVLVLLMAQAILALWQPRLSCLRNTLQACLGACHAPIQQNNYFGTSAACAVPLQMPWTMCLAGFSRVGVEYLAAPPQSQWP